MLPLPVIEVAFRNGQPTFLFGCYGEGYRMGLSTVTGEVVLPISLARHFLTDLGGSNNSRHPRRTT